MPLTWAEIREVHPWLPPLSDGYAQHPFGGGWVADTATVAAACYVGPRAVVVGFASVTGNAQVLDDAVVCGVASVTDRAVVRGNAVVSSSATVADFATVMDESRVGGNAALTGSAVVSGHSRMTGGSLGESAVLSGDVISAGAFVGAEEV